MKMRKRKEKNQNRKRRRKMNQNKILLGVEWALFFLREMHLTLWHDQKAKAQVWVTAKTRRKVANRYYRDNYFN